MSSNLAGEELSGADTWDYSVENLVELTHGITL
jgi:hypothetical protein